MDYDLQDIRARVTALEFLLKQLYIDAIRSKGGNALESALLTQSMAMHHLPRQISVNQTPENADRVTYQTIFIGQDAHGVVRQLKVTSDLTPSYFSWGNRYVRARVTSSKIVNGEPQSAWVQPRFFQHEVPDQFL